MLYITSLVLSYLITGSLYPLTTFVTIQRYYIAIDYIVHTVYFIPVTHLFCNWKFIPLNFLHLFHSSFKNPEVFLKFENFKYLEAF